jgi:predicted enzyme related to lactoylglutathione lyase
MHIVLVLDCQNLDRVADFWSQALGYRRTSYAEPYLVLAPAEPAVGPELVLQRVPEPKTVKNRMHIDIHTEDMDTEVARLIALGATRISTEPVEEYGFRWVVMADPEHNEFCVCHKPAAVT